MERKKKLEEYYEKYKNKILESNQEKNLQNFQGLILDLQGLELKIARLNNSEIDDKRISEYIFKVKQVSKLIQIIAYDIIGINNEILLNIKFLQYFLILKMMILCKKLNFNYDKEYFDEKIRNSSLRLMIEDIKFNKRKLIEDEKEIFKENTYNLSFQKTSLITV